jgi:ABC-type transport system involved in multi-copper enzyme maturation permease subunit
MKTTRYRLSIIFTGLIIIGILSAGAFYQIANTPNTNESAAAILSGSLIGTLICYYLQKTWDPLYLQPKALSQQDEQELSRGLSFLFSLAGIIVVIAGILLQVAWKRYITLTLWTSLTIGFFYMATQMWRHR